MKQALFYKSEQDQSLSCFLCPNNCKILEGHLGFCRVRKNIEGQLYSLNYGLLSSIAVDPIEKKPLYNFHSGEMILSLGTYGCNFHCRHCQNHQISQNGTVNTDNLILPEQLLNIIEQSGQRLVGFTYNEPLIWFEYLKDVLPMIKERGKQIVLVTNGYINQEALEEIIENIDAFSLDIKGYFDQTAMAISGVKSYGQVLDNARLIYDRKKHLEITTNIIDGVNDSEDELQKIASFIAELSRDIPWHLSRSFPHFQMMDIEPTPLKTIEKAEDIAKRTGLRSIYRGNI